MTHEIDERIFREILRFDHLCHWRCFLIWWEKAYGDEYKTFCKREHVTRNMRLVDFHLAIDRGTIPVKRVIEYIRHDKGRDGVLFARDSATGQGVYVRMKE
jgi:hypothetical protein